MNKLLHFIGIAFRAGKVQKGAFLTEKAIKNGTARLVIVAEDSAENTKDKLASQCQYYGVECMITQTKEMLGRVTGGGDNRSALAITDPGFAQRTAELVRQTQQNEKTFYKQ